MSDSKPCDSIRSKSLSIRDFFSGSLNEQDNTLDVRDALSASLLLELREAAEHRIDRIEVFAGHEVEVVTCSLRLNVADELSGPACPVVLGPRLNPLGYPFRITFCQ